MKKSNGRPYPVWIRTREHTIFDLGVRFNKLCAALSKALKGEGEAMKHLSIIIPRKVNARFAKDLAAFNSKHLKNAHNCAGGEACKYCVLRRDFVNATTKDGTV